MKHFLRRISRTLAVLFLVNSGPLKAESALLTSFQRGHELVEQALKSHSGASEIESSGGFEVQLKGTFDLTTRLQGRSPFRNDPTPIVERIVYEVGSGRVSYDANLYNYFSSNQKLREIYDHKRRMIYMDKLNLSGGWVPIQTLSDSRERFTRVLPTVLLLEALDSSRTLRHTGTRAFGGQRTETVSFTSQGGDALTLAIDAQTHLLQSLSSLVEMPLLGWVEMRWRWSEYSKGKRGSMHPSRLIVSLGKRVLKDVNVSTKFGSFPDAFEAPKGVDIGEPPDDLVSLSEFVPYGKRPPIVEELAPNIFMVDGLRPGFGMLFVEFDDFVVAIDAPTGWYEMNQIPPMNWSHGDSIQALGEKYVSAINQAVPNKPIRHLVLTHHHSDHIGGFMPFVNSGASILAGKSAAHMAKKAVRANAEMTSHSNAENHDLDMEIVDGRRVIADDGMEMQLIELPDGNPKADNYLMIYLPKQKMLYTTAFIYPIPESVFPPKESIPLSVYFVQWLDRSGLDVETIYNVHGMRKVEPWQLDKIRRIATTE